MNTALQIVRLVAVLALVCTAAAIATPKGRLPLALRGLAKMLNTVPDASRVAGAGQSDAPSRASRRDGDGTVTPLKRAFAFLLVILAILLALI